ncbi:unnamed protein product [Closterium sp. NIES-64]|nr:unnamed protein product [Closterium sp. NIES-64]CAI5972738.1 unnamed protein product [Closterium sp. NIES-65]
MSFAGAPANEDSESSLPPGFRFHPTDEELLSFYLPRKIGNQPIPLNAIGDIDMYGFEPWELPGKAMVSLNGSDEWFFFASRDRKYLMGTRANRMTSSGYWKATGKDRPVYASRKEGNETQGGREEGESVKDAKSGRIVGYKKGHVFYKGRAPRGEKTAWVMHEYRLVEPSDDPDSLIGSTELASAKSWPASDSLDDGVDAESAEDDVTAAEESDGMNAAPVASGEGPIEADLLHGSSRLVTRVTTASSDIVGRHSEEGTFSRDDGRISVVKSAGEASNIWMRMDSDGGSAPDSGLFSTEPRNANAQPQLAITASGSSENPPSWSFHGSAPVARVPSAHTIASLEALLLADDNPDVTEHVSHDAMTWAPHDVSHQVDVTQDATWWSTPTQNDGPSGVAGSQAGYETASVALLPWVQFSTPQEQLDKEVAEALQQVSHMPQLPHMHTTTEPSNLASLLFANLASPPIFQSVPFTQSAPTTTSHGSFTQPEVGSTEKQNQSGGEGATMSGGGGSVDSPPGSRSKGRKSPKRDREGKLLE